MTQSLKSQGFVLVSFLLYSGTYASCISICICVYCVDAFDIIFQIEGLGVYIACESHFAENQAVGI